MVNSASSTKPFAFLQVVFLLLRRTKWGTLCCKMLSVRPNVARFFGRAFSQTLPHLAMFAVMLLMLAPQASAFWECEGQKCGTTAWSCCCARPNDSQDADCAPNQLHFASADHAAEVGACALDCHCTMTVQDHEPSVASAHFFWESAPVFVAPETFAPTFQSPHFTESLRAFVSRGPPIRALYLGPVAPRGPPVA